MPAVAVDGVTVAYRTTVQPARPPTPRSVLGRLGAAARPAATRRVIALDDVTLEIGHGEAFGIIGPNGAGKSTLLRAIAGIVPPTAGRITVHGEVTALLSLDVGLTPDLTGAEHIELGGLARGLSPAEVAARAGDIAALADIAEVLDQPVRSYSSGMRARLAFAIAVSVEPDILLLDEALSTGDTAFRWTSAARMRELVDAAGTVVVVSHQLKAVTDLCDRVAWVDDGRLRVLGEATEVVKAYRRHLDGR